MFSCYNAIMINDSQIYIAVDIEADGPTPGLHSMLSLAAVATTPEKEIAQFYRKIQPLKEATPDPDTMLWWQNQPEAWKEVTTNAEPAEAVMKDFCAWLHDLNLEPVFVAHPVALDYTFVSYYLYRYAHENPFTNEKNATRTLDIRSFIAGKFGVSFNDAHRSRLPAALTEGMPEHTHKAIDDAIGYGVLIRRMLRMDRLPQ